MTLPLDADELRGLGTEQVREDLAHLDEMTVDDLVDLMCHDVRQVPDALGAARRQISAAVSVVVGQLRRGGRLIYVGAGTAGRLGMLDAAEAGPTFNVGPGQVIGLLAGGADAFGVPRENVEDDSEGGARAIHDLSVSNLDCVVGISASGRTPYVLGAIGAARGRGAATVGLSCNFDTPLSASVDVPIEVAVGPEFIAGSTRLNSGTAQKMVLNIISTATMVQIGKTYGNLMVDLRPTNEKLRNRSVRIVATITGADDDQVLSALEAAQWRPKVAAGMIVGEVSAPRASAALEQCDGRLRPALDTLRRGGASAPRAPAWRRLGVGAVFVDGKLVEGDVAVSDGIIVATGLAGGGAGIAVGGFVDAQLNGSYGVDLLNAEVDEILAMGIALFNDGVVAYQPTLITSDIDQLERAASRINDARERTTEGAHILGIHLEGPFLSPRRSGTHPVAHLRHPDRDLLDRLLRIAHVSMVTIAPELPGAIQLIERCVSRGVRVSLGHSAAHADDAHRGFDAGATAVTHLFNAMESVSARSPGLAGVALTRDDVCVQIIADGVHVCDELLRLAFQAAPHRVILVSDAIAAAGVNCDVVALGEVTVHISDGEARREDGTLAGSVGKLRDALVRVRALGVDVPVALQAAISRPATLLEVPDMGSVRLGQRANLFILDETLTVTHRVREGEVGALS